MSITVWVDKSRRERGNIPATKLKIMIRITITGFANEEKPFAIAHERLSGELLGLTCGCDRFGKKVSQ